MSLALDLVRTTQRNLPALAVALALHAAAAVAVYHGMRGAPELKPEAVHAVTVALITPPKRIEPVQQAPAPQARPARPKPRQAQARPQPVAPKQADQPVKQPEPAVPAPVATAAVEPSEAAPASAPLAGTEPVTNAGAPVVQAAAAVVTPPLFDAAYLNNPKPAYPLAARRLGEEGTVLLYVQVSPQGHAAKIEVRTSSGSRRLDRAAENAVAQWRFVPARRGDEAVAAWVLVPLVFRMNG